MGINIFEQNTEWYFAEFVSLMKRRKSCATYDMTLQHFVDY